MRKDGRKTEKEAKSFALPTWAPVLLLTRDDTAVSDERIWIDRLVHRISTAALELWIWRERRERWNVWVQYSGEESAGTSGRCARPAGGSSPGPLCLCLSASSPNRYLSTRVRVVVPKNFPFSPRDIRYAKQRGSKFASSSPIWTIIFGWANFKVQLRPFQDTANENSWSIKCPSPPPHGLTQPNPPSSLF